MLFPTHIWNGEHWKNDLQSDFVSGLQNHPCLKSIPLKSKLDIYRGLLKGEHSVFMVWEVIEELVHHTDEKEKRKTATAYILPGSRTVLCVSPLISGLTFIASHSSRAKLIIFR